ncbi:hypothetical protein [Psychrobacter sp. Cmf 22.2]|uniref:hypothetical protein n=1 Tax=Psychrobacter sp. Cmf 22.2 TaxID=1926478 RepID=UPI00094696DD|nr:hypothetical protein [Psychrobacter sp. Cmf 22.2]OLF38249.1 hypothetical protein BTV98_05270 [Psychrobacter sp. Cmf 22.2]
MEDKIYDLGAGFWSIRGSFIKNGILDIGVQCALVKLSSGRFIFLDSYTLTDGVRAQVMALTNDGQDVEAVLNVHPFHTVHCEQMAKDFPQAIFYGSSRHPKQVPNVKWSDDLVESDTVAERYPELEFSLPKGIHYIAPDESVHASSLLVFHSASLSIYVDDTFEIPPSKLINTMQADLGLHPTTLKALKDELDAGKEYCDWATQLAHKWRDVRNFCGAHSGLVKFEEGRFEAALLSAIDRARPELEA